MFTASILSSLLAAWPHSGLVPFGDKMAIMDIVVSPGCVRPSKENLKDRMMNVMPREKLRARHLSYEELYCETYDWVRNDSTGENEQQCRQFRSDLRFRIVVRLAIGCSTEGQDLNLSASVIEGVELRRRLELGGIYADKDGQLKFQPDQDYTSFSAQHVVKFDSWPELEHAFLKLMDRVLEVPTVEFASDLPPIHRGTKNVVVFHRIDPRRPDGRSFFGGAAPPSLGDVDARIIEFNPTQHHEICSNPNENWWKFDAEVRDDSSKQKALHRQDRVIRRNSPHEIAVRPPERSHTFHGGSV